MAEFLIAITFIGVIVYFRLQWPKWFRIPNRSGANKSSHGNDSEEGHLIRKLRKLESESEIDSLRNTPKDK